MISRPDFSLSPPFSRSTYGGPRYSSGDSLNQCVIYSLAIPLLTRRSRRDKQTRWWTEGRRTRLQVAWWWSGVCRDSRWGAFGKMWSRLTARPTKQMNEHHQQWWLLPNPMRILTLWHFSELSSHAKVTSTNFSALRSSWNMSVRLLKESENHENSSSNFDSILTFDNCSILGNNIGAD